MMKTYGYESIDSRFQASSSDVPFAAVNWREYPIGTQTISAGFAVDYRELQNGNFDGNIREGMNQVQIDMQNKMTYYVMTVLYNALKNAKGVKHFAEDNGITKTAVDNMLKSMRRYGKVNIAGDYSVVSQFNDFAGFKQFFFAHVAVFFHNIPPCSAMEGCPFFRIGQSFVFPTATVFLFFTF